MNAGSISLLVAGIALAPAFAHAADWYRWESENGTVSYTDDEKRVPARHRGSVERIAVKDLESYPRFTEVKRNAGPTPWQLETEAPAPEAPASAPKVHVKLGGGSSLELDDDGSDEPIHVMRKVWRYTADGSYRQHTIVERGGREIAVIEGVR